MSSIVKSVVHWGSQQRAQNQNRNLCETCGKKPKFVERGFEHPYCGRSCARTAQGNSATPSVCALHGCRATGRAAFSGFCSEPHSKEGVRLGLLKGCTQCKTQPSMSGDLCVACDRRARVGPRIRELDSHGATFKSIASQFSHEWKSQDSTALIEKVYEVSIPRDIRATHEAYRQKLPALSGFQEIRTYHSSQCICDLGVNGAILCDLQSCGICNIVKSSFRSLAFNASHNTGRYGAGIYSYLDPGIADHFSTSCISSPYRVMLACDTIVAATGKQSSPDPRGGLDSINDGERVFVSNSEAIVPAYVIVYTK